jgi:NADPH2:quinone reductase
VKAIRIHETGGPEVLRVEELPVPEPAAGQVVVRVEAVGVNYTDIYSRVGLYPSPLPSTPGQEAAGIVTAIGSGVSGVLPGQRVAYTGVPGAYAEYAAVPAAQLIALPDGVTTRQGAAAMLQGMTAHFLATSTYPVQRGESCLVHAAAGGVGLLLCQIAKLRGARVIGTVSTAAKAELARAAGADDVILYTEQDFEVEVRRLVPGGVHVVYDSVGKTTFEKSLNCLVRRGMMVLFGQSSGPVPPFDLQVLNRKGALYITRPSLGHYLATREELVARSSDVLGWVAAGKLRLRVEHEFPLVQAAEAHRELEARRTTGKVLLIT